MVKSVLQLVYREVRGLHQAAYVLALFAFLSQLLALVRDRALAHQFGAGIELDIYYAAFRIPDLLYVLFASSLSVYVLIPLVAERVSGTDSGRAQRLLSQVATVFLLGYSALAAGLWVAAPWLVPLVAPGLSGVADEVVAVQRILLLQPLLLGLSSLCGVVTQLGHRFVLYAVSPLIYNVGIILGILALYPVFGLPGLAVGVVVGALGHLLVQWPFVRESDLSFALTSAINWRTIGEVLTVSIPRAITLAVHQFVLLITIAIASLMTIGSVTVFQFAYNLQSVPLAIIGASYSIAAFPLLADLFATNQLERFRSYIVTAIRHIIFWSLPVIALIIVLRAQFVRVVLGTGAFDWSDTKLVAAVLALLAISLCAQAFNLLCVRAFYAAGDTRTPLIASVATAVLTVLAMLGLYQWSLTASTWQEALSSVLRLESVVGVEVVLLAIAYSAGALLQAGLLLWLVVRRFSISLAGVGKNALQAFLAALFAGVSAYITINFVVFGINPDTFIGIFIQGLCGGVMGGVAAIIGYYLLRSRELREVSTAIHARLRRTQVMASQDDVL